MSGRADAILRCSHVDASIHHRAAQPAITGRHRPTEAHRTRPDIACTTVRRAGQTRAGAHDREPLLRGDRAFSASARPAAGTNRQHPASVREGSRCPKPAYRHCRPTRRRKSSRRPAPIVKGANSGVPYIRQVVRRHDATQRSALLSRTRLAPYNVVWAIWVRPAVYCRKHGCRSDGSLRSRAANCVDTGRHTPRRERSAAQVPRVSEAMPKPFDQI
jgi:hypothetical protein